MNSLAKFNSLIWINKYISLLNLHLEENGWNPKDKSPLRKVIFSKYPAILTPILNLLSDDIEEVRKVKSIVYLFLKFYFKGIQKHKSSPIKNNGENKG